MTDIANSEGWNMNLSEIIKSLPNGLHDSLLKSYRHDLFKNEISLELSIWTGELHSEDESERERYEDYIIDMSGIGYWSLGYVEDKNLNGDYGKNYIDVGIYPPSDPSKLQISNDALTGGKIIYWLYIQSINQNIVFTCEKCRIIKI